MENRFTCAAQTLSRFGELEWFGLSGESNSVYGYLQVPYMKLRFKNRDERTAQLIEDAVRDTPTQLEWTLDKARRNWVLLPSRIILEARDLLNPAFAEAVNRINAQEPDFCRTALSDFDLIIAHLQEVEIPDG
ncbi:hypothetical protein [Streptomyces edwardsiae]|uniref:Uncharacterized protein n=1 Tax=Streptomyces edwardsiae TaxID=3075527 RepID=A0ABU2QCZ8_9ACTN|nr:hypothetical protein [Streptomyces sp. DSM 41635]MDT0402323.1 hypothetical protein [Streptomyces sp. DSM 41635]